MLLENEFIQLSFDEKGRPVNLTERSTGRNCCVDRKTPLFMIKQGEKIHKPDGCSYREGKIRIEFKAAGVEAVIAVDDKRKYFVFEVISVSGVDPDEFTFLNLKVNLTEYTSRMSGVASDGKFAFCLRQLNLQVAPTLPPVLRSTCYKKYGFEGARAALVGFLAEKLECHKKHLCRL